jgi:hypothetical protein
MNKPDYYIRQKDAWDESEIRQLRTEYLHDKMTISQIADIHQRTPGVVSYKLKGLGYIDSNTSARGYSEYKKSELYRAIVEKEKVNPKPFTRANDLNIKVQVEHTELAALKDEIATLKQDVKEVLRLIHAMYEVEM